MAGRVEIDGEWEGRVGSAVVRMFDDTLGPEIAGDARRYCPVRTGDLKKSIEHHLEGDTLIVSATGSDEESYAYYVEMGTRPHVIRPRAKKALFWEGAEHPVGKVDHPGTKPQPFLRPALYKERSE